MPWLGKAVDGNFSPRLFLSVVIIGVAVGAQAVIVRASTFAVWILAAAAHAVL